MNRFKQQWHTAREKFAEISLRERGLASATVVAAVVFIWLQFVFLPWESINQKQKAELQNIRSQQISLSDALSSLEERLKIDPNKALKLEQKQLNEQLKTLTETIEGTLSGLVAPEKMVDILRDVLAQVQGLKLIGMQNLPVVPVDLTGAGKPSESQAGAKGREAVKDEAAALYSHGMELVVEGRFFDVLSYVKKLETLPGIYWQALDYEVLDYPKARVTLRVSTLSLEKHWLGV